ncbi:MAG TPA: hypothetical protein VGU64_22300, partial [Terriglobales bacterium]|nr:hypothetical protein [Terriglobales bacterium]
PAIPVYRAQTFGSTVGNVSGTACVGVPEWELVAKNLSYRIGALRCNRLAANSAKSINGPNACHDDYAPF